MANTFRAHWNTIVDMLFRIVKSGFVCRLTGVGILG